VLEIFLLEEEGEKWIIEPGTSLETSAGSRAFHGFPNYGLRYEARSPTDISSSTPCGGGNSPRAAEANDLFDGDRRLALGVRADFLCTRPICCPLHECYSKIN
jgi:hypothetical protein